MNYDEARQIIFYNIKLIGEDIAKLSYGDRSKISSKIKELTKFNQMLENELFLEKLNKLNKEKKEISKQKEIISNDIGIYVDLIKHRTNLKIDAYHAMYLLKSLSTFDIERFINSDENNEKETLRKLIINNLENIYNSERDLLLKFILKILEDFRELKKPIKLINYIEKMSEKISAYESINKSLLGNKKVKNYKISENMIDELIDYTSELIIKLKVKKEKEKVEEKTIYEELSKKENHLLKVEEQLLLIEDKIKKVFNEFDEKISF